MTLFAMEQNYLYYNAAIRHGEFIIVTHNLSAFKYTAQEEVHNLQQI